MPRCWGERTTALALIGLAAASTACEGSRSDAEAGAGGTTPSSAEAGPAEVALTPNRTDDSLAVELRLPDEAVAGEAVRMRIRIRNTSERPIALHLLGREIAFDFVVRDAGGTVVWERLEGETVITILRLETLGPGQALDLEGVWDQRTSRGDPAAPGDYTVQGSVPTDGEALLTEVLPLRIAAPG